MFDLYPIFVCKPNQYLVEPMAKTIIHIGYPKTASTWFQQCFYPHVKNWRYLHRDDFRRLVTDPFPFRFNSNSATVLQLTEKETIICDEGIIGGNPFIAIDSLNRVRKVFQEAKIILFIRNQPDMMVSKYSQYVFKNKGTQRPEVFFGKDARWHRVHNFQRFHGEYLCYHLVVEYLQDRFGAENVFVYLFEEFTANPEQFTRQFAIAHNLSIDTGTLDFSSRNEGLRLRLYPIVRFLNIFTRYSRRDKYYLIHIPYWHQFTHRFYAWLNGMVIFGKKPKLNDLLGRTEISELLNLYSESNEQLVPLFGREKLLKYNYPLIENE